LTAPRTDPFEVVKTVRRRSRLPSHPSCAQLHSACSVVLLTQISVNLDQIAALHRKTALISVEPSTMDEHLPGSPSSRQRQHHLTWDERQQAAALYLAGASMNEVAATLNVHRSAVVRCLRLAGVPTRTTGPHPEAAAEAVRLYAGGWSLARLEDKFGVSDSAVMTALRRQEVQTRPRNGWAPQWVRS
jgi:hypothetical protein